MKKLSSLLLSVMAGVSMATATNSPDNPLPMPYSEGFDNASFTSGEWSIIPISGETATMKLVSYDPVSGLYPHMQRDKGFMLVENDKAGEFYLMSPHVMISEGFETAKFKWAYFHSSGITVEGASEWDGSGITADNTFDDWGSDPMNPAWTTIGGTGWPPIAEQTGHVIRFGWKLTTDGQGGVMCIDNMFFGILSTYDLGLVRPHATPSVKRGGELLASVEVGAFGELTTKNFNVTAFLDGEKIGEYGHPDRGPWGERRTVCDFSVTLPEDIAVGRHEVSFDLVFEGDYDGNEEGDLSNNKASVYFEVTDGYLPMASGLTGEGSDIIWDVPAKGDRFTDDIESLASFDDGSIDVIYDLHPIYDYDVFARACGNRGQIGPYTVIDGDQKPTVCDDNWVESLVPNVFHLMSCIVADFTVETDVLTAASGNKALLFWSNADGTPADNYLVLPGLNANDRKVTFKARAYDSDTPEKIELMTSSTDTEAASFTAVKTVDITDSEFKTFEFDVPSDAVYVAIRHISDEGYGLVIDDISYAMEPREVIGYNVYLEGEKVNEEPIVEPRFTAETEGNYSVTVVYPEGESERTAEMYFKPSGIDGIQGDTDKTGTVYYNLQGIRVDAPSNGIFIRSHNGKTSKVKF